LHDSHMQNCHDAAANTYIDDIAVEAWHDTALARVQ